MIPDNETAFLIGLMELHHGLDKEKELRTLASGVAWAQGWPENTKAFWNAEAFMWQYKVSSQRRALIAKELSFLNNGRNLDLGCGSYSYIASVGFDFSEKMLLLNEQCYEKIAGNLEQALPFEDESFDSVTAVLVLNYISNYVALLKEIKRILRENGVFTAVFYFKSVNQWQRQKEINSFSFDRWEELFEQSGFSVVFYEKEALWFFRCVKISAKIC